MKISRASQTSLIDLLVDFTPGNETLPDFGDSSVDENKNVDDLGNCFQ